MANMRLQNRFSFLADHSPRDDDAVAMQRQERERALSWDDPPGSFDQALNSLKTSYQRKHRIDTPLGLMTRESYGSGMTIMLRKLAKRPLNTPAR